MYLAKRVLLGGWVSFPRTLASKTAFKRNYVLHHPSWKIKLAGNVISSFVRSWVLHNAPALQTDGHRCNNRPVEYAFRVLQSIKKMYCINWLDVTRYFYSISASLCSTRYLPIMSLPSCHESIFHFWNAVICSFFNLIHHPYQYRLTKNFQVFHSSNAIGHKWVYSLDGANSHILSLFRSVIRLFVFLFLLQTCFLLYVCFVIMSTDVAILALMARHQQYHASKQSQFIVSEQQKWSSLRTMGADPLYISSVSGGVSAVRIINYLYKLVYKVMLNHA